MIGEQIGSYRILSQLGAGGMGVVFLAEDTRLNRRVALKFIRADLARSADADARLVREARAASALDHPNVATIYDIGEWQGRHFVAMAWYDGETLATRLDRGRMSVSEAVGVLTQIADGLGRAHAAGIVHRDLKPGNVMVTRDGVVKILDFGLAAYSSPDAATEARLTQTGSTMGTVAYMAPEQAIGGRADARTDIWAFGVLAYEMLAGERPFRGAHEAALLHAIQYDDPVDLKALRPDVPEAIRAVVMKALKRSVHDRPQTVDEISAVLRAWTGEQASAGVAARQAGTPVWRRPFVMGTALVVILVTGTLAVLSIARQRRVHWAREVALPEAARLADAERIVDAFDLVARAEAEVPGDSRLAELKSLVSRTINIRSDPPGTAVSYKDYQHPDAPWRPVGTTPIDGAKIPAAYLRWRFEKSGFTTVELPRWSGGPGPFPDTTTVEAFLKPIQTAPAGMIFVPATTDAYRLFLPGFEHLAFPPIGEFWIDDHEVTNAEFKKFVDGGGYGRRDFWQEPFVDGNKTLTWEQAVARFVDSTGRPGPATWTQQEYPQGEGDYPVTGVSWYEASAYARFAGKSLPTAHHWARAAEPRAARWVVPFSNFGGRGATPASARPTLHNFGGRDMAGNVKEWTSTATGDGRRYILGGGFDDPPYAYNDSDARQPFDRGRTFGFRCVVFVTAPAADFLAPVPFSTRDYHHERPVSDAEFKTLRGFYTYERTPLDAKVARASSETADWRREDVTIAAAYGNGSPMRVFLYLPKRGAPPYQTVVFMPGSNALRTRSIDQFPLAAFDFLMKSGRAVAFPEFLGTFARQTTLQDSTANMSPTYRDHVIAWVKDFSRSVDYLETRQDLSLQRLAYVGSSWGGRMGAIIPAIDARVTVQVLVNGGFSLQAALPAVDQINFASRVSIPTLMLNGKYDFYFPEETSQKPMFDAFATPADKKLPKTFDGGHNIPRAELIKETLAWLDRFQGVPKTSGGS